MAARVTLLGAVGAIACGVLVATPAQGTSHHVAPRGTHRAHTVAYADYNGDGYGDLAIGAPGEDVGSHSNAGAVNVLYGSPSGLTATGNQVWTQDSPGVVRSATTNAAFGASLVSADFNGDGFTDLAVGVPFESLGSATDAGGVEVLYGSASGLSSAGDQFWSQNSAGVAGSSDKGDEFGSSLAVGDFDGSGTPDLAIGVPHESSKGLPRAGAVTVLLSSFPTGLTASGDQQIKGTVAHGDFGSALAAGQFNGSGRVDLAVGASGRAAPGHAGAGRTFWLSGTSNGLRHLVKLKAIAPTTGAHCGASMAAGYFDDFTSPEDLVVGCPNAINQGMADDGQLNFYLGAAPAAGGLGHGSSHGGAFDIRDYPPRPSIELGASTTGAYLGDNLDVSADAVVAGMPLVDFQGHPDTGEVLIDTGAPSIDSRFGVFTGPGKIQTGALYSAAVTAGDFNGDGWNDLAIGIPGYRVGRAGGAGAINILVGSKDGPFQTSRRFFSQNSSGVRGRAESEDFFGDSLSGDSG